MTYFNEYLQRPLRTIEQAKRDIEANRKGVTADDQGTQGDKKKGIVKQESASPL